MGVPQHSFRRTILITTFVFYSTFRCSLNFNIVSWGLTWLFISTGEKPFPCPFAAELSCGDMFQTSYKAHGHMQAVHRDYLYHCIECSAGFAPRNPKGKTTIGYVADYDARGGTPWLMASLWILGGKRGKRSRDMSAWIIPVATLKI